MRRNNQSRDKLERAINRHFPAILGSNIDEISTEDIKKVIDNIPGRAIAGRMQEFLQSVFKYATETGYVKQNPVLAIPKIKQHCRIRPLNKSGFHRLTRVINAETDPVLKSAFLMLIYGFASKASIFAMQWRDLDFNHYTWCEKPLSDMAVVLLQDLPQNGRWVFPGRDISVRYVDRLTALCIDHGFSPLVRHEVSSTMQQIAYASCGQGLALVPEFFASLLPDSVVAVRLTDVEPCIELSMVWDETTPNAVRDRAIEIARSVSS